MPGSCEYVITEAGIPVVSVAANITTASHTPVVADTIISAGHVITGASPLTSTLNEAEAVFPEVSVAV